jgi:hypothetical protein
MLVLVWLVYAPLAPSFHAYPLNAGQLNLLLGASVPLGAPIVPDWWFLLVVKTPIILFELATGLLVRKLVVEKFGRPELGTRAFALYFLNPYVMWIGSIWGMFDAIPTFFGLLGILWLLEQRDLRSGLAFGVAVSLKYFPGLILLALAVGLGFPRGRPLLRFLVGFGGVLGAISAPFLLTDAAGFAQGVLSPSSGSAVGNLSIWTLVRLTGANSLPIWLAAVDLGAIAVMIVLIASWVGRHRSMADDPGLWVELAVVSLLTFYILFPTVNNQYITWVIPFLAISVALGREKPALLVALSALALLYTLVTVGYYSFFLPILTIDPRWTWLVPRMYAVPTLARAIAILIWGVMTVALIDRVRRSRGYRGPSLWSAWSAALATWGTKLWRRDRESSVMPGS